MTALNRVTGREDIDDREGVAGKLDPGCRRLVRVTGHYSHTSACLMAIMVENVPRQGWRDVIGYVLQRA